MNPSRFISSRSTPGTSDRENEEEKDVSQDLTLQLLQCCDVESLGSAVKNGLESYLPEVYGGALFYVDEINGDVITADNAGLTVCSPTPTCIKQAHGEKQQVILTVQSTPSCVLDSVRNTNGRTFTSQTQVLCSPVLKGQNDTVNAVLVVAVEEITDKVTEKLSWLEKQIAACYSHIQRTFQGRAAEERASQQLIKLCGELYDQDAAKLQLKVLKYLEDQTQAECAFLLLVVPETQELFCQVIGKKILDEEIRFPGQSSSFSVALETKQPLNLDDIPVENRKGIEEVVEIPLRSFLCVPVTSRNDDNLIALACLVNKQNGNRFSERDVTCIRQCFRYTSTVLTSTLAFQNERKIKIQTQALLQVARHLFTNLGELSNNYNHGLENFPYIRSREWEVNVWGTTLLEAINSHRLNKKLCRNTRKISHLEIRPDTQHQGLVGSTCTMKLDQKSEGQELLGSSKRGGSYCPNCCVCKGEVLVDNVSNGRCGQCMHCGNRNQEDPFRENGFIKTDAKMARKCSPETVDNDFNNLAELMVEEKKVVVSNFDCHEKAFPFKDLTSIERTDHSCQINETYNESGKMLAQCCTNHDKGLKNHPTILLDNSTILSHTKVEEKGNISAYKSPENELLLLPKLPDNGDEESDYASAYTNNSDTLLSSSCAPDEMDSLMSFITASEFESNSGDFGNESLKVHCDNESSQVSNQLLDFASDVDNMQGYDLDQLECPKKRRSFNDINEDDFYSECNKHPGKMRLSNSEPCFHGYPADISDNRTSCGENNKSLTADSPGACNTSRVKGYENDNNTDQFVHITLEKADISDIQAWPTELRSITENDLTKLLREVMAQARNLTHAERCSVFLIDDETDELVAKVFDGISTTKDNEVQEEIRLPSTQGIAGHVATSGELLNIKDAYSHPLFYRGIDDTTGFRTRNILCFPIKNEAGRIMGVAQLCNKKTGPFFTQFDEDLATAFGIYCCISISHSLLYKKVIDSQVRNSLANELMMYHMKSIMYQKLQDSQHRKSLANELMIFHMQVSPEDVTGLTSVEIPHPRFLNPDFVEFSYAPRSLPESATLLACLSMFEDLNLISRYRIKREALARFVLMVKKGYRNPPYHNWTHAYTVAQFCYQLVKNMKLAKFLDGIEIYALFVSCLCHDIDHRGTNNSFQTASKSVLAALYSSEGSVLERHHFAQTMCILNTEGCNIFENLNSREYQQMLDLIRDIILATDLAHHLKILKSIREMSVRGYDGSQPKDRKLLLCLLMTSCDLSDQTKPWNNTKNVAALIYKEFFTQGDMEKASGFQPAEMMDRERAQIPEVQIGFLDHIALPVYQVLGDIFPEGHEISDAVQNNKKHWEKIRNLIKLRRGGSCARMTFDEVIAIEHERDDVDMERGNSEQLNHSVSNGSG